MMRTLAFGTLLLSTISAAAHPTPTVSCNEGESLNRTLARIEKFEPVTVTFTGTCREYVLVDGFSNLTLKGEHGATIQQPSTPPSATPPDTSFVLSVKASHSVTLSGFAVHSQPTVTSSIGIGGGSNDVLLNDITAEGSWGVYIYEASQVWLIGVTVNLTSGYAAISAFDKSDVHIVNGLVHRPADGNFDAGVFVVSGHVTVQGLTIRDMQQGIVINSSGSVDIGNFHATTASTDVTIENPSGTNNNGALVMGTASLNVGSAKLVITNAGQPWGGDTGGVLVSNGSTLTAGSNLVVSGSQGQGVVVSNNSHADFGGSSITGSSHGGLVVVNSSTATADASNPLTVIGSNGTDLFCDSNSQIAGAQNIANATAVQCQNLLPRLYKSLP